MRLGDIVSTEWWVMSGDEHEHTTKTEQEAIEIAERIGGTVRKVEWKYGGKL
jgi:hypothetical protein